MHVHEALRARKSVRAYQDRPVEKATIERILDSARWAPSGTNTQPWEVCVTLGESKRRLDRAMQEAFRSGVRPKMDYEYYPLDWQGVFAERRKECGLAMYSALDIGREDKQRRIEQWARNYSAFDAPVSLYFFIDPIMETGSFFDFGLFVQSIMLLATEEGLGTCPQAALGEYPDIVREHLDMPEDHILICGMAMGYEDKDDPVNNYRTSRLAVGEFARFYE